jgi:hypothetical protein
MTTPPSVHLLQKWTNEPSLYAGYTLEVADGEEFVSYSLQVIDGSSQWLSSAGLSLLDPTNRHSRIYGVAVRLKNQYGMVVSLQVCADDYIDPLAVAISLPHVQTDVNTPNYFGNTLNRKTEISVAMQDWMLRSTDRYDPCWIPTPADEKQQLLTGFLTLPLELQGRPFYIITVFIRERQHNGYLVYNQAGTSPTVMYFEPTLYLSPMSVLRFTVERRILLESYAPPGQMCTFHMIPSRW